MAAKMPKILVADDDIKTRAVLSRFLAALSCEIIEARDGEETLERARAHRPEIILLDIYMPKGSGVRVLKELVPEMPGTGFIIITGNEDVSVARECLELGAFDYISKPINLEILGEILKTRLSAL